MPVHTVKEKLLLSKKQEDRLSFILGECPRHGKGVYRLGKGMPKVAVGLGSGLLTVAPTTYHTQHGMYF